MAGKHRQSCYSVEGVTFDVVIALGNLMDVEGKLNPESQARLDLACDLILSGQARRLMTCGWNYRADTPIPIAEAMAAYARPIVGADKVEVETRSRDTVGDAVFSRLALGFSANRVAVATSEYHTERAAAIFSFVYGLKVTACGAPGPVPETASEAASLAAFRKTFAGVQAGDFSSIFRRMMEAHPFYNGCIYPAFAE